MLHYNGRHKHINIITKCYFYCIMQLLDNLIIIYYEKPLRMILK